jgi:hypothetical protein
MVLTTKKLGSLIQNSEGNMTEQPKIICRVLRSFDYKGKNLEVGKTVELPQNFAREMKEANKVEFSSGGGESGKPEAVDPMDTVKSGKK